MTSATLTAIDRAAHELRNAANVVLMGGQLLAAQASDPLCPDEIASVGADVRAAGLLLAQRLDRIVEAARCELARPMSWDEMPLGEVMALAARRASRQGCAAAEALGNSFACDERVRIVAGIAERVLADVMMLVSPDAPAIECEIDTEGSSTVGLQLRGVLAHRQSQACLEADVLTHVLAKASDIQLEMGERDSGVQLRFARP